MQYLRKPSGRYDKNPSAKYVLDCQSVVDKAINTIDWLVAKTIIYNDKIDNKKVIVKLGNNERLRDEYAIGRKLQGYDGFVEFICKFQCLDNADKYKSTYPNMSKGFCEKDGEVDMQFIVMPYFEKGTLSKLKVTNQKELNTMKYILHTVISNYLKAYRDIGFIHGDFHADNVMLTNSYTPVIIDYEFSKVGNQSVIQLGMDFVKLFASLTMTFNIDFGRIIPFTVKMRDPFENANINVDEIHSLIDELRLIQ